jgi:predicted solute-binding protein
MKETKDQYIEGLESIIKNLKNKLKKERQDKKNNYRKIRYSKTICDTHPEMGRRPPWPYTN